VQSDGRIESFDLALLDPHGGELQGYVLLRRSEDPIDAVRRDEHFERVMIKASLVVDDLGLIRAQLGDGLAHSMAIYQEQLAVAH